jgi:hypothetical protein
VWVALSDLTGDFVVQMRLPVVLSLRPAIIMSVDVPTLGQVMKH